MFDVDELLGRASLKERIDELEEETDRLQARYEAEADRRADATTAKQEAERRVNRLEDRIAQLEGELERIREDDEDLEYRRRDRIRGVETAAVVDRLRSYETGAEGALTTVVDESGEIDTFKSEIGVILGDRISLVAEAGPCLCCIDDVGLVAVTLSPPVMPDVEPTWDDGFALEREWFLPTGQYVLAVARADLFAVGQYDDGERTEYQGFESDVKGSHSKGGFSQARFERIRDEQIDSHLEACAETLETVVDGDLPVYLVGQRGVVETLAEESDIVPAATAAVDATGKPKNALEDAHRAFWTTDLRVL